MKRLFIDLIIILLFASFFVFFQSGEVPKKLAWDEVDFARLALSLKNKDYIAYSELATGHSTLYFYLILGSIGIFGLTNFALRFPAALFGILNAFLFYFVIKKTLVNIVYFKKNLVRFKNPLLKASLSHMLPLFLTLIFITNRWYFNFARFSFEATFLLFLELISIYFFLSFKKSALLKDLIISAVFAGLAFLSYTPGRIFFMLPLFFLFFNSSRKRLQYVLIFVFSFLIVASPLIMYLSLHTDLRIQDQFFLSDKRLDVATKISYIKDNMIKISAMFNLYGDLNGRHNYPGKPMFNPVVGAFFLLGACVSILNYKNYFNIFFLAYFVLSIIPALLTYPIENPNSLRTYTSLVPSLYFVGNGVLYLIQSEPKSRLLVWITCLIVVIIFCLSSLYDIRTYFLYQRGVFQKAFELNGSINRILNLELWENNHLL